MRPNARCETVLYLLRAQLHTLESQSGGVPTPHGHRNRRNAREAKGSQTRHNNDAFGGERLRFWLVWGTFRPDRFAGNAP